MAQRNEWTNVRMARELARPFCPKCYLFLDEHKDKLCDKRYTEEEPCASSVQKLPSLESLQLLDGDSGLTA